MNIDTEEKGIGIVGPKADSPIPPDIEPEPYSIIKPNERIFLIIVLSLIGFWSTISNTIYFPALPTLSEYFNVSESVMNLSVVAYLVFQGIVPTFSSNLADTFGRRPIVLLCLIVFIVSCIGLSQTNVFWLLAVLRCVQAAGIAPTIAINSGIGGDVTTRAERGGFVGVVSGFQLLGNGFGGLIGSGLMQSFDWRGIFIFLTIGSAVTFVLAFFLLPETKRLIVGNGSILPKYWIHRAPVLYFFKDRVHESDNTLRTEKLDIFSPFRILKSPIVLAVLFSSGISFASWTMALASISTILEQEYNYSVMQVGYVYLPQGIALLTSSLLTGRFLNWYYKRCKTRYDMRNSHIPLEERPPFNIYKTRLHILMPMSFFMNGGLIIFGWCMQYKKNIASIIISTMMISASSSTFIASGTTMLVDLHPDKGSTLTSCMNLSRCLLAALGTGVLSKLTGAIGVGGCYTLMSGLCIASYSILVLIVHQASVQIKRATPSPTPIEEIPEDDSTPG